METTLSKRTTVVHPVPARLQRLRRSHGQGQLGLGGYERMTQPPCPRPQPEPADDGSLPGAPWAPMRLFYAPTARCRPQNACPGPPPTRPSTGHTRLASAAEGSTASLIRSPIIPALIHSKPSFFPIPFIFPLGAKKTDANRRPFSNLSKNASSQNTRSCIGFICTNSALTERAVTRCPNDLFRWQFGQLQKKAPIWLRSSWSQMESF